MNGDHLGICPEFRHIQPKFDLHVFECVDSTSAQLWKMVNQGAEAGTVAIAQRQSAGRGQRGRSWLSGPGGLYLSVALSPDWPVDYSAQLTCMSAWGIATALNNLGVPVQIKWPNDLFFEGKKLGGILTETRLAQASAESAESQRQPSRQPVARIKQAVIGVGINWHNQVPETGTTLTKILKALPEGAARNKISCLEVLAALVLRGILQGTFFQQQVGNQAFMKAYQKLLTQTGKTVSLSNDLRSLAVSDDPVTRRWDTLQLANRSGEVVGISEEGYLKVALCNSSCFADGSAPSPDSLTADGNTHSSELLLLKPSEIHIS